MKLKFILISVLFSQLLSAQMFETFTYYNGYNDYINDTPIKPEILTFIKVKNSKYILVDSYDFKENDNLKKEKNAWALKYENDIYMNMSNASFIPKNKVFAKFDIIGKKYMVILLDEKEDSKAIGIVYNPYGGGLLGSALDREPKRSWRDKNNKSFKILFIDKENLIRGPRGLEKNVLAYLLDSQKILELYNKEEVIVQKLKKDEYFVEDFIEFVNKANQ